MEISVATGRTVVGTAGAADNCTGGADDACSALGTGETAVPLRIDSKTPAWFGSGGLVGMGGGKKASTGVGGGWLAIGP
jgi:hypothetical protein